MQAMFDLVRGLSVDAELTPGVENPFRQVIVNTHSVPYLHLHLREHRDDVLFAEPTVVVRDGRPTRTVSFRPLEGSWRAEGHPSPVTPDVIQSYLEVALGGQIRLFVPGAA